MSFFRKPNLFFIFLVLILSYSSGFCLSLEQLDTEYYCKYKNPDNDPLSAEIVIYFFDSDSRVPGKSYNASYSPEYLFTISAPRGYDERETSPDTGNEKEREGFVLLASYSENRVAKEHVQKWIRYYTTKGKRSFSIWLKRSGKYMDIIREILRENDLPEDLVYLPLIESGFRTEARSPSHAVGPWQFISATAKRYGLKINYWIDERRDPVKSTRAASRYLKDLYRIFKSWPLTLAAYNAGEGAVLKALRKTRTDDYWRIARTRYLKKETRRYVSKFIAAGMIASEPEKYGFTDLDYHAPLKFEEVKIKGPAALSFIAKCSKTSTRTIKELNPEIKRWCTPPEEKYYVIRIPEGRKEEFLQCYNNARPSQRMPRIPYIIKKGDTIYDIAKKYRVRRKEILALNRGINPRRLRPGKILYLPPE